MGASGSVLNNQSDNIAQSNDAIEGEAGNDSQIAFEMISQKMTHEFQKSCSQVGMGEQEMHDLLIARVMQVDHGSFFQSLKNNSEHDVLNVVKQADEIIENHIKANGLEQRDTSIVIQYINSCFHSDDVIKSAILTKEESSRKVNIPTYTKNFVCELCNVCFETANMLKVHQEHSETHFSKGSKRITTGSNMGKQRKLSMIASSVGNALNKMNLKIQTNMNELQNGSSQKKYLIDTVNEAPEAEAGTGALLNYKLKWKRAINKIIAQNMTNAFREKVSDMFYSPMDIKLLSSVTKLYIINPTTHYTYDIRLYLHFESHCVEVVAHYIKHAPNPRAAFATPADRLDVRATMRKSFATSRSVYNSFLHLGSNSGEINSIHINNMQNKNNLQALNNINSIFENSANTISSHNNFGELCETIAVERIYLDYNVLLNTVMGYRRPAHNSDFHSTVQDDTDIGNENHQFYRVHIGSQLLEANGFSSSNNTAFNNNNGNKNSTGSHKAYRRTIDDAIISFIHSHLYPNKKNSAQQHFHAKMSKTKKQVRHNNKNATALREEEVFKPALEDFALVFNGLSTGVNPVISAPLGLGEVFCVKKEKIMEMWEESWINL